MKYVVHNALSYHGMNKPLFDSWIYLLLFHDCHVLTCVLHQAKKKPSWTYADSDDEGPDIFGNPIIEGKRKCARKLDYKAYC